MSNKFFKIASTTAVALFAISFVAQAAPLSGLTRDIEKAQGPKYIPAGRPTLAPYAFVRFCAANPAQCKPEEPASKVSAPLPASTSSDRSHVASTAIATGNRDLISIAATARETVTAIASIQTETIATTEATAEAAVTSLFAPVDLTFERKKLLHKTNSAVNAQIRPQMETLGDDLWQIAPQYGDCEDYALTKRRDLIAKGWPVHTLRMATARTSQGEAHAVLIVTTSDGDLILDNRTNTIKPWNQTDLTFLKIQSSENPKQWSQI